MNTECKFQDGATGLLQRFFEDLASGMLYIFISILLEKLWHLSSDLYLYALQIFRDLNFLGEDKLIVAVDINYIYLAQLMLTLCCFFIRGQLL